MKIPFGTISVTERSKKIIGEVLEANRLSSGKYVREFEKKFAELVGTKEAVAVSTGTDAVALALAVLYVDVDRKTLNIDVAEIEEKITKKTKAIVPVHLMGKPADMDRINSIAEKYNLYVIEDAAEAHGAVYKGRNIGTLGDMAAYSLYVAHIISTVEGGIVTTDNSDFAEILRSLRSHGRACKCESCVLNKASAYCDKRFGYGENEDIRFIFERIGFSSKMNEMEAAVGIGNLDIYYEILSKRRENLYYLIEEFKKFAPYLTTIEKESYEEIGPHALPIVVQECVSSTRTEFISFMEKKGIDTRNLFSSMPTQCAGFRFLGHKVGDFPNAEYIGERGIHIGVHQGLGKKECNYIIDTIEEFLSVNV